MLLANSRPRWWSSVHCVALERIGDRVAVHDFGRGFGTAVWSTYPPMPRPPSASDNVASVSDNLSSTVDQDISLDNVAAESLAVLMEDLATDLVVGALHARKSRGIVERLNALLALSAEERLKAASRTYSTLELSRVSNDKSTNSHWLLIGTHPRARFYVASRKRDSTLTDQRLTALVRPNNA